MKQLDSYVSLTQFCSLYEVEVEFVRRLEECGIVEFETEGNVRFEQLDVLERMIRLHKEFNINAEGLEAVFHLSELVEELKIELKEVKARLKIHEG